MNNLRFFCAICSYHHTHCCTMHARTHDVPRCDTEAVLQTHVRNSVRSAKGRTDAPSAPSGRAFSQVGCK